MKFSFILPAYKAKFLKQAINSILLQTYEDFELIIVNDASPDDIDSIISDYKDCRIRYYKNQVNIGRENLVAHWNKCLTYSMGEYIILASDDDFYSPSYLYQMSQLVLKYPNNNVFRPRIQIVDQNDNILHVEGYTVEHTSVLEFMYLLNKRYICGGIPFYLFKKEALLQNGGFVNYPMAWRSDDATVLLLSREHGLVTTNEILFSFRMSGENITSKRNNHLALKQKLTAVDMFYKFQSRFLEDIKPKTTLEQIYADYLNRHLKSSVIKNIYELICDSTLSAGMCCFSFVRSFSYISVRGLLINYMKRIVQELLHN